MLTPVPPHPVPAGPLAVRWLGREIPPLRAGATMVARVELENAGAASWRAKGTGGVHLSYHWLDLLGNPIVWAGVWVQLPERVAPGERLTVELPIRGPIPPGRYRLALDLVDADRAWFAELGNQRVELDLDVAPRLGQRTLAVRIGNGPAELVETTTAALTAQEEPVAATGEAIAFLAAGCRPAPDWSTRVLAGHNEGYAVVAGSIAVEGGRLDRRSVGVLAPWAPGFGRSPNWSRPLLCPSLVEELVESAPWIEPVAGLPALDPKPLAEPWLCDGRIRVAIAARALAR